MPKSFCVPKKLGLYPKSSSAAGDPSTHSTGRYTKGTTFPLDTSRRNGRLPKG